MKKKADPEADDWIRPECKRSDLGPIVRGKYSRRMADKTGAIMWPPHARQSVTVNRR